MKRLISLVGSNPVLLAAAVILPLGASFFWWGPLRSSLRALDEERAQHVREIEALGARTETLKPLDAKERFRLGEIASALRAKTVSLGVNATTELVHEVATLLETAGVNEVRVIVEETDTNAEGLRHRLEVPPLERAAGFVLVPHAVQVRARANFVDLRRALEKLHDPSVPTQIQRASFVRDGFQVRSELDLIYWSREEQL